MPSVRVRVAVLAETAVGERRVAAVPESVRRLIAAGADVAVQRGAGRQAFFDDDAYRAAGAAVVDDAAELVRGADIVLSVQPAPLPTLAAVRETAAVVSLLSPSTYPEQLRACRDHRLTAFALELVPRTSRAQAADVLSSQALVAGYRGVLAAAERLPAFFPAATTAAGTVPAARVLVLGVGVAGLQAIATARRLGADVVAHDVRPSSPDEVRSLGATFLPLELGTTQDAGGYARAQDEDFLVAQRRLLTEHIGRFDAVITTAAVPGRRAPLLLTTAMVERMRAGSVVVDLAAEAGGNCQLTRPGEDIVHAGVVVYGPTDVPSSLSRQASELFSRNVAALVLLMMREGRFVPHVADEVVAGCRVTSDGRVVQPVAQEALGEEPEPSPVAVPPAPVATAPAPTDEDPRPVRRTTAEEVARLLLRSRRVAVVPGYGLAVARAQHLVRLVGDLVGGSGVDVVYAVHPVAGRMPGHLDVVLDEAGVPAGQRRDVAQANAAFPETDVVLVVGASDVVNPAARRPGSALTGMPVLDVEGARHVVVLKRSLRPGFADVENPLLHAPTTTLLLGDLEQTLTELLTAVAVSRSGGAPARAAARPAGRTGREPR